MLHCKLPKKAVTQHNYRENNLETKIFWSYVKLGDKFDSREFKAYLQLLNLLACEKAFRLGILLFQISCLVFRDCPIPAVRQYHLYFVHSGMSLGFYAHLGILWWDNWSSLHVYYIGLALLLIISHCTFNSQFWFEGHLRYSSSWSSL